MPRTVPRNHEQYELNIIFPRTANCVLSVLVQYALITVMQCSSIKLPAFICKHWKSLITKYSVRVCFVERILTVLLIRLSQRPVLGLWKFECNYIKVVVTYIACSREPKHYLHYDLTGAGFKRQINKVTCEGEKIVHL